MIPDRLRMIEPLVPGPVIASRDVLFTERANGAKPQASNTLT